MNAFKEKFDTYYPVLCKIAYGYVPDADDCEDIVQETFISTWHRGKGDLPDRDFFAYMLVAVKNNCISFLRKRSDNVLSLDDDPPFSPAALSAEESPSDDEAARTDRALENALNVLPPKCREVFLLSRLNGLKYRDIAALLNLSEKTVENHMGKAIRLLRDYAATHPLPLLLLALLFPLTD